MVQRLNNRLLICIYLSAFVLILSPKMLLSANETVDFVHYRLGVKYQNENKYDLAIEEYRKVLASYPDHYNTYMHLAEIMEKQGRVRLALFNVQKALAYNPGWGKAQKKLAQLYEQDRQYALAVREWQGYQEVCDPEERDSVQMQITRLTQRIQKKPSSGEQGSAGNSFQEATSVTSDSKTAIETTASKPAVVSKTNDLPPAKKKTKSTVSQKPEVEELFKQAVLAYQDAGDKTDSASLDPSSALIKKILIAQPGHSGAYYYAGLIRRRKGQDDMAKFNFTKALSNPEYGTNAHFYLGKILGEQKKYAEALVHLKSYMSTSDYPQGRSEAEMLISRYEAIIAGAKSDTLKVDVAQVSRDELQKEISDIPPEVPVALVDIRIDSLLTMAIVDTLTDAGQEMLEAVRLFHKGDFDGAIEQFKKMLVSHPKGEMAVRSMYDIAICYFKLGNYVAAENQFKQIIDRYPSHVLAVKSRFLRALTFAERRDRVRAESELRAFLQNYRSHEWAGKAYERLGDMYADLEQYGKAVDAYQLAATSSGAKSSDALLIQFKAGECYQHLQNPVRAIELFTKVIDNGEKNNLVTRVPDAHYRIADSYYKAKEYTKAMDYYRRAVNKYPDFHDTPWGLYQIGSIYKNLKNYEKAVETFKDLKQRFPEDYWTRQAAWKMEDAVWENEYRSVLK